MFKYTTDGYKDKNHEMFLISVTFINIFEIIKYHLIIIETL